MSDFVAWNSQPLHQWAEKFASGKTIRLDGHTTHYIEKGQGSAVILLHGFFLDSYTWAHNIETLAGHFKVYAIDLWGFGYSTREPMDYSYQLYADQVLKFMDVLGIQKASIVGHSMGGGTGIKLSVLHRERVHKLIIVDPSGLPAALPFRAKLFTLPGVGEFFMGLKSNSFRRMNLDLWFQKQDSLSRRNFDNLTRFHKVEGTTESIMAVLRKNFFHSLAEDIEQLATLDIPVLIVWGRDDRNIPVASGERLHQILKGSRLEILDGAGHTSNFESPAEFNSLVIDFLV